MDIHNSHKSFKAKAYSHLAKDQIWLKYLKPDLERYKAEASLSEAEPETEFEAVKRDIKRAVTLKVINKIINLIEKSEDKVVKIYGK